LDNNQTVDPAIMSDLNRISYNYRNILKTDYYIKVFSNYVPEVSVIHKKRTLCQKTRSKLQL